jgi:hypothetical protein
MHSRFPAVLATLGAAAAIAVPAVAQARGGSDDPPNHEQRAHQIEHARGHDRFDRDRRAHHVVRDRERHHDGRGSDDGAGHD